MLSANVRLPPSCCPWSMHLLALSHSWLLLGYPVPQSPEHASIARSKGQQQD
jgi:hypothetical protein